MEINMNDEDLMNIMNEIEVDDIIEEMDDESDEDHSLSDDSDWIMIVVTILQKIIDDLQINALNGHTKHCAIYFYYSTGGALDVCASCMASLTNLDKCMPYESI